MHLFLRSLAKSLNNSSVKRIAEARSFSYWQEIPPTSVTTQANWTGKMARRGTTKNSNNYNNVQQKSIVGENN